MRFPVASTTCDIETSLTTDYRRFAWGIERIVLDSISNHLPADSKGSKTTVRIKQEGRGYDLKRADPAKPAEEVVFEDDGAGYSAGLLSVLFSPKAADVMSVGQFGEGLKLVAAAALRSGIDVEYRSKNWIAVPYAKSERIDEHAVQRLCFHITENGDHIEGSRTVFRNPSKELMREIFKIPEKVLALNDSFSVIYAEGSSTPENRHATRLYRNWPSRYHPRIIDLGAGDKSLFIKGVRVQTMGAIFSYDLGLENISPDRLFADRETLLNEIARILKECTDHSVIETLLREAETDRCYRFEFEALRDRRPQSSLIYADYRIPKDDPETEKFKELWRRMDIPKTQTNPWVDVFRKLYGENAVLASSNVNENSDARLMGFNPVKLNSDLDCYLGILGIKRASSLATEKQYRWVDRLDLTPAETGMLERIPEITETVLGELIPVDVRVYSGLFLNTGREIESQHGVYVRSPDGQEYIGIKQSQLQSLEAFASTYIHELGHLVTGKGDYYREFTDFFIQALTKFVLIYMTDKVSAGDPQ